MVLSDWAMLSDHYPLAGLRLTTSRLTLCLGNDDQIAALGDLAFDGPHDPSYMPFSAGWTDDPPPVRARSTITHQWLARSRSTPDAWGVDFVVIRDGVVVGTQAISGRNFAVVREVDTGSWLGRRFHGQGIGTEMRAAVLHLAFAGLRAERATSGAFSDNPASLRVSEKLGYQPNGIDWQASRNRRGAVMRLVLTREAWERTARVPVRIEGLTDACRAEFGLA
jgi:RimJ/RimL family protein N-acetyltransferase